MTGPSRDELLPLVESFFREHLQRVRGASPHTVRSYRDSLRLFLCFLADSSGKSVADLGLAHIEAERVLSFLEHLETRRGNSVSTRNLRLAAIRSLAQHLLRRDPTRAGQYRRILDVPTKKSGVSHLTRPDDCASPHRGEVGRGVAGAPPWQGGGGGGRIRTDCWRQLGGGAEHGWRLAPVGLSVVRRPAACQRVMWDTPGIPWTPLRASSPALQK